MMSEKELDSLAFKDSEDLITTVELAKLAGVKPDTIHQNMYLHEHFRGLRPVKKKGTTNLWARPTTPLNTKR